MQGGASQGLGIALSEEMVYDDKGRLLNGNLLDYRLPTTRDLPPIETIIVEVTWRGGGAGGACVGEAANGGRPAPRRKGNRESGGRPPSRGARHTGTNTEG